MIIACVSVFVGVEFYSKKDKISLDLLLTTYRKVIIDEFAEDVMLKNWYTDEGLILAGLKPQTD